MFCFLLFPNVAFATGTQIPTLNTHSGVQLTQLHIQSPQYFVITNYNNYPVVTGRSEMVVCKVVEGNQKRLYRFPYMTIDAGKSLIVYTGSGKNTQQKIYMGVGNHWFTGCHDSLTLYHAMGGVASYIRV
jgi:hypothetical protein